MNIDMLTKQKFAEVEADLISASALGASYLHAEAYAKFSALNMDEGDLAAVMDGLLIEQEKTAFLGTPGFGQALVLGALLAPPLMTGAGMMLNKMKRDAAFEGLKRAVPDLAARDPQRLESLFSLLFTASPTVAANTLVAADLIKQMMAMPMIDLGTVGRLIDLAKHKPESSDPMFGKMTEGALGAYGKGVGGYTAETMGLGKTSSVKVAHIANDGTRCILNWNTEACKTAGITDAFVGNGTGLDQANNAQSATQMQDGSGLLPLDNIVRELIMKEQELAQREEMLAQREAETQQMQQMMQQMGSQYQDTTGVNPDTGNVEAPAAEPQPEVPEGEMPEGAEVPEGEMPEGESEADTTEQEMPTENAENMPPIDDDNAEPEPTEAPPVATDGETYGEAPAGEAGIDEAEANAPYAGEEQPVEGEEQPVEGEQPTEAGTDEPIDPTEHDTDLIDQGLASGPVQPEDVQGTPEDAAHDAINNVKEEGSDKDNIADSELAAVLNAGGHLPGGQEQAQSTGPVISRTQDGGHEFTLPLRFSFKVGEKQGEHETITAARRALADLFN